MYDGPWEDIDYGNDEDEDDYVLAPRHSANTLRFSATCPECGLTSQDVSLLNNHSCDVQKNGGRCEDYPCCGHESGDCNGLRYGSDESIKEHYYRLAASGMDDHEIDMYYDQMGDY
jgi:hypothetical protein